MVLSMTSAPIEKDVRHLLKLRTGFQHQLLHEHPLFNFQDATFPERNLNAILECFLVFFSHVATMEHPMANKLLSNIEIYVQNLRTDLKAPSGFDRNNLAKMKHNEAETLGWYYVAIGSNFGRSSLLRLTQEHDLGTESKYLRDPPDTYSWTSLMSLLDGLSETADVERCVDGACNAFSFFKKLCDTKASEVSQVFEQESHF